MIIGADSNIAAIVYSKTFVFAGVDSDIAAIVLIKDFSRCLYMSFFIVFVYKTITRLTNLQQTITKIKRIKPK